MENPLVLVEARLCAELFRERFHALDSFFHRRRELHQGRALKARLVPLAEETGLIVPIEHRIEMVRLGVESNPRFRVDAREVDPYAAAALAMAD